MSAVIATQPSLGQLIQPPGGLPAWAPEPVSRDTLDDLHALMSLGPALLDTSPTRALFLTSEQAKARLAPHVASDRRGDVTLAPVCVVIGYDPIFAEQLCEFLPNTPWASGPGGAQTAHRTALRNGALQGAYLIVAARSLGLEAAAFAEFDADAVAMTFFRQGRIRVTFVGALGYAASPA
jgi:3-hydroxypropanoate dehydrogenase